MLLTGAVAQDIPSDTGNAARSPLLEIFWLDFPDQWDPKSPWPNRRVRLAASLAIDREALNEAETRGLSRPTGTIVPRDFEFAIRRPSSVRSGPREAATGRSRVSERLRRR